MAKELIIDLGLWTTQKKLAEKRKCSVEYISKLVKQGKIKTWKIKELNDMTLVDRNYKN